MVKSNFWFLLRQGQDSPYLECMETKYVWLKSTKKHKINNLCHSLKQPLTSCLVFGLNAAGHRRPGMSWDQRSERPCVHPTCWRSERLNNAQHGGAGRPGVHTVAVTEEWIHGIHINGIILWRLDGAFLYYLWTANWPISLSSLLQTFPPAFSQAYLFNLSAKR